MQQVSKSISFLLTLIIFLIAMAVPAAFLFNIFPDSTGIRIISLIASFVAIPWLGAALYWITLNLLKSPGNINKLALMLLSLIGYTLLFLIFTAVAYFTLTDFIDIRMPSGHKFSDTISVTNTIFVTYTLLVSFLATKLTEQLFPRKSAK